MCCTYQHQNGYTELQHLFNYPQIKLALAIVHNYATHNRSSSEHIMLPNNWMNEIQGWKIHETILSYDFKEQLQLDYE